MPDDQAQKNRANKTDYDQVHPNDRPSIYDFHRGDTTYIGNNTSNRKTWNGMPWIDYWRTFANVTSNEVKCAICGRYLYVHWDELDDFDKYLYTENEDKAEGGHIAEDTIHRRFWIVPMCPTCNGQEGNTEVTFDHDVTAVEEKYPNIV